MIVARLMLLFCLGFACYFCFKENMTNACYMAIMAVLFKLDLLHGEV